MGIDPGIAIFVEASIWNARAPVLWLVRRPEEDPADSGWCAGNSAEPAKWMIVSIAELIERDPSVERVLDGELGASVYREDAAGPWIAHVEQPESR